MDNKLNEMTNNNGMMNFEKTDDIIADMQEIIETAQKQAHRSVNALLVQRNWLIGYRISVEELDEEDRAEYGTRTIKELAKELTKRYGKGFDRSTLYRCFKFYKAFPDIVATLWRQSGNFMQSSGNFDAVRSTAVNRRRAAGTADAPVQTPQKPGANRRAGGVLPLVFRMQFM